MSKIWQAVFLVLLAILIGLSLSYFFWLTLGGLAVFALAVIGWRHTESAFYFLVAYLPFQLALNLAPGIDLLSGRVLILLLFFVWLAKRVKDKKPLLLSSQVDWALVLFFAVAFVSLLVAQNQLWGLRKILVFASVFPLYFLTKALLDSQDKLKKLLRVTAVSAVVSALVAFGQFLAQFVFGAQAVAGFWAQNIAPLFYGRSFARLVVSDPSWFVEIGGQPLMRAIGLFPDPHTLAFYLGLISPLVLAMALFEKKYRKFFFVIFCLLFVVLLLTFSRGGYLGLFFSFLIMFLLAWKHLEPRTKVFVSSLFLLTATLLLVVGLPIVGRFLSSFNLSEGSALGRLKIWQESLAVAKDHLITGVGLGNYPLALNPNEAYRSAVTSHNLYLDILTETGVFGLLVWLWLLAGAGGQLLKKIKIFSPAISPWAWGLLGSLVYFSVHSFFETAIFSPTILAVLMMFLGLSVAVARGEENRKSEN